MRRLLSRLWARTLQLWERARLEHSTPRELGWSLAVGVFCGCTPFVGLHLWIALGTASLLRLNRLWAYLGSRVSTTVVFVWIAWAEIGLAHRLRSGAWPPFAAHEILAHGKDLAIDWLLGTVLVGTPLALVLGLAAYAVARRRVARALTPPRTPAELPAPTSGSRPSAPPDPTP